MYSKENKQIDTKEIAIYVKKIQSKCTRKPPYATRTSKSTQPMDSKIQNKA